MPYGEKCIRCGDCCKAIPCGIGHFACGDHRPCKALELVNGKYQCGIVVKASKYMDLGEHADWKDEFLAHLFSQMLGFGMGCCTSPENESLTKEMRKRFEKIRKDF